MNHVFLSVFIKHNLPSCLLLSVIEPLKKKNNDNGALNLHSRHVKTCSTLCKVP